MEFEQWAQVLTIIATMLGGIFYIHIDVREIRKDIQQQGARTDKLYEMYLEQKNEQSARFAEQTARSDKLYEMFIDLLKNKNTP